VSEIIDWLVDQEFRQWQAISAQLETRRREHGDRILGTPDIAGFHEDRARLLDSVGREAQRVVDGYDRRREAQQIADAARTAVAATAAVGAGAVGIGAIVAVAASTAAADVTGILMASVMAALGFLIIPARRRKARVEMREKVSALVADLSKALGAAFARAQERSAQRFTDAVGPYTRFVRAEDERWQRQRSALTALRDRIAQILAGMQ
jgi:hypothetical protein